MSLAFVAIEFISLMVPEIGDIGQALKARATDTNKVVQALALDIITRIATGMNKPFERHCRILVTPVANVLADQKTNIRAAAVATLTAIATACEGLEPMVHPILAAFESTNPLLRSTLLTWIGDWCKEHELSPSLDLAQWAAPVVGCLEDRSADVRKASQAVLPFVITHSSFDHVMNQTTSMKAATRQTIVPLIQALKPAASAPATAAFSAKMPASTAASSAAPSPVEAETSAAGAKRAGGAITRPKKLEVQTNDDQQTNRLGVKPKILGVKKPGSAASSVPPTPISSAAPFQGTSLDVKKSRLAKDAGRWIIESGPTRRDLAEVLQHQMEPCASKALVGLLFSHDHNAVNDHLAGLSAIYDCYSQTVAGAEEYGVPIDDMKAILVANSDLPLKYVSTKVHEPQPNLVNRCLDVLDSVLALLDSASYQVSDTEASCFLPTIIYKVGFPAGLGRHHWLIISRTARGC